MSPRIVVLMSAFNEERYLQETIPAVLAQSMRDFVLLVLDNGSTDRTRQILEGFTDPRIHRLLLPSNMDPPTVMNAMMTIALGTWRETRWFLSAGADDVMDPSYLEAIFRAVDAQPEVNCVYSPQEWIGAPERGVKRFPAVDAARMHNELQVPAWRAITRELWEAVGREDERIRIGSDWDWSLRAAASGYMKPHQLDRPYLGLRIRTDRVSQSDEVDWPTLHGHLMWTLEVNYGIAPAW